MLSLAAGAAGTATALMAACGTGGEADRGTAGRPVTGAVAASGSITTGAWGSAFSDQVDQKVIDAFHAKQSRIKVELLKYQGSMLTALMTLIAGGDPPTTALIDGPVVRAVFQKGGAQDLTDRIKRDGIKKEDYVETWFDEFLYKNKYYYFPVMRGGNAAMFYNKNLLEKVGAKLPTEGWTLQDWLEVAQKTTRDERGTPPTQGGFDPGSATFGTERPGLWHPFLWTNGAELIDLDKNVCVLDSPAAIETLQFLQDLVHKHKVTRNSFAGTPSGADLFVQGRLATRWDWFTEIPRYRQEINNFDWDVVLLPQGKLKKQLGLYKGNGQTIPVGSKNPDAAWEFMKFLGGYDAQIIYGTEGRFIPSLKRANQDPTFVKTGKSPKNMPVFYDNRVKLLPLIPEFAQIESEIWNPNLAKIWNNEAPVKDVAQEMARRTTDLIKDREKY